MIKPWGTYVAVVDPPVDPQENKLSSGLYLPESATIKALNKGVVVGVGPDVKHEDDDDDNRFTYGSVIWYAHGAAYEVGAPDGEVMKFVPSAHIVCWDGAPAPVEG